MVDRPAVARSAIARPRSPCGCAALPTPPSSPTLPLESSLEHSQVQPPTDWSANSTTETVGSVLARLDAIRPNLSQLKTAAGEAGRGGGATRVLIRREYFDRVFFWNAAGLARKLHDYKCITTRIESIVRLAARPPRYAPAYPQLFQPRLTVTRGGHIAAVCFRTRSPPDLYFATHTP